MKKRFYYWKAAVGLIALLATSLAGFTQDFFYIPDQNAAHNTKALALGSGAAIPPATGTANDNGMEPNPYTGYYYTSTNVGVSAITLTGASVFTNPSILTVDDVQASCVHIGGNPFFGFQNSLEQGEDAIIQVVIQKKAPLTAQLSMRVKIYFFNAGTATSTDLVAQPTGLAINVKLNDQDLTPVNKDLAPGQWTYSDGTNYSTDFAGVTNPTFAYKSVPVNLGDHVADCIVFRGKWKAPAVGGHYCLFAMIEEGSEGNGEATWTWADINQDVANKNNVAWRNLSILVPPPAPPKGGNGGGAGGQGPQMREIMVGNPFGTAETMYFQWKPTDAFDTKQFQENFKLTLDLSGLPKDNWPNKDSIRILNGDKRIEYDDKKGVMTLYTPELVLPGMHFKPHEVYPLRFSVDTIKAMPEGKYATFVSVFEQYWVNKSGKKVLIGGQEIAVNNYQAPAAGTGGGTEPAPECTGLMCWLTTWWFWLIIVLLLGLIVWLARRKKS